MSQTSVFMILIKVAAFRAIPPRPNLLRERYGSSKIMPNCCRWLDSLAEMARSEIGKLESERPNDPAAIERNDKQREILLIFADGFERIAAGLAVLAKDHGEPTFLRKASNAVNILSREVNAWFKKNRDEAVDWGIRLPILTAGVAVLGWAGANMTVATSTVAALVGGPKVMDVIRGKKNHNEPSPGQ